jgi:hypothetical protein
MKPFVMKLCALVPLASSTVQAAAALLSDEALQLVDMHIRNDYIRHEKIGESAYGAVYRGTIKNPQSYKVQPAPKEVAIKVQKRVAYTGNMLHKLCHGQRMYPSVVVCYQAYDFAGWFITVSNIFDEDLYSLCLDPKKPVLSENGFLASICSYIM